MSTDLPKRASSIDLNADVAEGCGQDDELLKIVSSANVCCGLHAGSYDEMRKTLILAKQNNLRVGAHPGFDDRKNFGRINQTLSVAQYRALLAYQLGAIQALCDQVGVCLDYVKPHGALYNQAAIDKTLSDIIVNEIKRFNPNLKVMGLSGGYLVKAAKAQGLIAISEVFADRNYEKDGSLVSRSKDNAVITDTNDAVNHVMQMIIKGEVTSISGDIVPVDAQSICLHGDSEHAIFFAKEIKQQLERRGITISA